MFISSIIPDDKKNEIVKKVLQIKDISVKYESDLADNNYLGSLVISNLWWLHKYVISDYILQDIIKIEAYIFHNDIFQETLVTQLTAEILKSDNNCLQIKLNHQDPNWKGIGDGLIPKIDVKIYLSFNNKTLREIEYSPNIRNLPDTDSFQLRIGQHNFYSSRKRYIVYCHHKGIHISISNMRDNDVNNNYKLNLRLDDQEFNNKPNINLQNLNIGENRISIDILNNGEIEHTYEIIIIRVDNFVNIAIDMGTSGIVVNYKYQNGLIKTKVFNDNPDSNAGVIEKDPHILSAIGVLDTSIPISEIRQYLLGQLKEKIDFIASIAHPTIANLKIQHASIFGPNSWINEETQQKISPFISEFQTLLGNNELWSDICRQIQNNNNQDVNHLMNIFEESYSTLENIINIFIKKIEIRMFSFIERWSDLNALNQDNKKILVPAIKLILGHNQYQGIEIERIIEIYTNALIRRIGLDDTILKKYIITVPKTFTLANKKTLKDAFYQSQNCLDVNIITEAEAVIANYDKKKRNDFIKLRDGRGYENYFKRIEFNLRRRVENILAIDIGAGTIDLTFFQSNHSPQDNEARNSIVKSTSVLGAGDYIDFLLADNYLRKKNISHHELNSYEKFIFKYFIKLLKENRYDDILEDNLYQQLGRLRLGEDNYNQEQLKNLRNELITSPTFVDFKTNFNKKLIHSFLEGIQSYKIDRIILSGRSIKLPELRKQMIKNIKEEVLGKFWSPKTILKKCLKKCLKKSLNFDIYSDESKIVTAQGAYEYFNRAMDYLTPNKPLFSLIFSRADGFVDPIKICTPNDLCKNDILNISLDNLKLNNDTNYDLCLKAIDGDLTINNDPIRGQEIINNSLQYNNLYYTFSVANTDYSISPLSGKIWNEHTCKKLWPYF